MLNNVRRMVSILVIISMVLIAAPISFAIGTDFQVVADTVTVQQGATTEILIPVRITKVPADKVIGAMALKFVVDPANLTFQSIENGPLIINEAQDVLPSELPEENGSQGTYVHMFAAGSDSRVINTATVTTNNLYVTLKYKLTANLPAGTYPITILPAAELNDNANGTIISKSELGDYLTSGAIVVEGDSPELQQKAVKSITAPAKVSVATGTAWNSALAKLPSSAQVTYSDDTTGNITVTWVKPNTYDGTSGTYPVSGSLVLPNGVTMGTGVVNQVSITLEVADEDSIEIVDYDPITLAVNNGTTSSEVLAKLPKKVTGYSAEENNEGQFNVTWNTPSNYKATIGGKYTFNGELQTKSGYTFSKALKATVTVKADYGIDGSGSSSGSYNTGTDTTYKPVIKFKLNAYTFTLDNSVKAMDAPFIYNDEGDRSMAPVRFISEALGYNVVWDGVSKATITKGDKSVILEIGSETMYVNGAPVNMDTAPVIKYERTYIPVRFIAEAFGLTVGFDSATQETTLK